MDSIRGINLTVGGDYSIKGDNKPAPEAGAFKDMLTNAITEADDLYAVSSADTQALLSGEVDNIAEVMINGTKTQMALNMVVEVRNKVVEAYNEIMRMQL